MTSEQIPGGPAITSSCGSNNNIGSGAGGQVTLTVSEDHNQILSRLFDPQYTPGASTVPLHLRKLPPSFFLQPSEEVRRSSIHHDQMKLQANNVQVLHTKSNSSPASLNPENFHVFKNRTPSGPHFDSTDSTHSSSKGAASFTCPNTLTLHHSESLAHTNSRRNNIFNNFKNIFEVCPLNRNFGMALDSCGQVYFLNHETQETTWFDPRLPQEYQTWGMTLQDLENAHKSYAKALQSRNSMDVMSNSAIFLRNEDPQQAHCRSFSQPISCYGSAGGSAGSHATTPRGNAPSSMSMFASPSPGIMHTTPTPLSPTKPPPTGGGGGGGGGSGSGASTGSSGGGLVQLSFHSPSPVQSYAPSSVLGANSLHHHHPHHHQQHPSPHLHHSHHQQQHQLPQSQPSHHHSHLSSNSLHHHQHPPHPHHQYPLLHSQQSQQKSVFPGAALSASQSSSLSSSGCTSSSLGMTSSSGVLSSGMDVMPPLSQYAAAAAAAVVQYGAAANRHHDNNPIGQTMPTAGATTGTHSHQSSLDSGLGPTLSTTSSIMAAHSLAHDYLPLYSNQSVVNCKNNNNNNSNSNQSGAFQHFAAANNMSGAINDAVSLGHGSTIDSMLADDAIHFDELPDLADLGLDLPMSSPNEAMQVQ